MHLLLILPVLAALALPAFAQSADPVPEPPRLPVRGYLLADHYSGAILAADNAEERMEPASITKLMTAYVVYSHLRDGLVALDQLVSVSEKAWRTGGSRMFIEVNTQVSVEDLLRGMVIQSGNDATVALAEFIAGSEEAFVTLMNRESARLGMTQSSWRNTTGLPDPEHYTTARDIATLTRALIRDFPEPYRLYSEREFTYNDITQSNRNRLLWQDASVDGVKTGHTSTAGYCLVSSARRDGTRLIAVVLGADREADRFSASLSLLNYGFRFFETHRLFGAGESLTRTRVWKGRQNEVSLGLAQDLWVTVPRGRYSELTPTVEIADRIQAPLLPGSAVGEVVVSLGGQPVARSPLVALEDIPEAGLAGRLWDGLLMTVFGWFQ